MSRLYLCTLKLITVDEPRAHHRPSPPYWQKQTITHFRHFLYSLTTLNTTKRQTFSSFAMDGDHISGVCCHPLPNTGRVPQHISDSINTKQRYNQASKLAKNSYFDVELRAHLLKRRHVMVIYHYTLHSIVKELWIVTLLTWNKPLSLSFLLEITCMGN